MKHSPDISLAEAEAESLLKRERIASLPVEPIDIAARHDIVVKAAPSTQDGVSGLLLRSGNTFGILYATHIESEGFQRFSISHELGHYFMPGHVEAVLADGQHESRAMGQTTNPYEAEADAFAAALLMPQGLFTSALRKVDDGLTGIEHLAALCRTSLLATASRYIAHTSIPAAMVVSIGCAVDYCRISPALREFRGLGRITRRTPLPSRSLTAAFHRDSVLIATGMRQEGVSSFKDWFGGTYDLEVTEEVKGLGAYGKTLTILTLDTFADELDDEDSTGRGGWRPPLFR